MHVRAGIHSCVLVSFTLYKLIDVFFVNAPSVRTTIADEYGNLCTVFTSGVEVGYIVSSCLSMFLVRSYLLRQLLLLPGIIS